MPCETESEAATHDFSQAAPQSPDASLAHFWKKKDEQNLQMREFPLYHGQRVNVFMTGSHSYQHPWTKQLQG